MAIDRRQFVALAALVGCTPFAAARAWAASDAPRYLTARQRGSHFEAVVMNDRGTTDIVVPLPDRGHSFAIDAARGRAVAFGRQPGFFALAFDLAGKHAPTALPLPAGRHYFGHGVYTPDGMRLIAAENDYENGRSVLGVYDASSGGDYRRIGEFDGGGIGAHEVVLMPDGRTLCVANGGILTHPDYGKLALNEGGIAPSLDYIDAQTGILLEHVTLDRSLGALSVRHLGLAGDGTLWFGCQYNGPAGDRPPLVGRHRRGHAPELFAGPPEVLRGFGNYIGSVTADRSGTVIATSSPVGGQVVYWEAASGRYLGVTPLHDGCGIAPHGDDDFLFSSGNGVLERVAPTRAPIVTLPAASGLAWDNHLRAI